MIGIQLYEDGLEEEELIEPSIEVKKWGTFFR
jgi:hypothetical protein